MKLPIKEREFSTVIIVLAVIVVIVLGVLQYRWSNQVSEATSIRLADSLQMSMINWHLDFFRVFSEVCVALRVDPESSTADDWDQYARRYADWKKTTANPNLVSGLYILRFNEAPASQLLRIAPSGQRFEPSDWPSNFAGIARRTPAACFQCRRQRLLRLIRRNKCRRGAGRKCGIRKPLLYGRALGGLAVRAANPCAGPLGCAYSFRLRRPPDFRAKRHGLDRDRAGPE